MRTAKNVQNSDGTLIITRGMPTGGTKLTIDYCIEWNKPRFVVNLQHGLQTQEFADWVRQNNICTLNVAGPRESSIPWYR
jgi:hypothetical protein